MYTYYLIRRPAMPGTCPGGIAELENFDYRTFVPEIGRDAWAKVSYKRELAQKELDDYEMVKGY